MVSNNGSDQSQDNLNLAQALQTAGDDSSQQVVFDDEPEPGAGNGPGDPTPEPRVFSEEEVRAIQSAGDQQIAQAQKTANQAILMIQRERAERDEADAHTADLIEVENGDLSTEGAQVRVNERAQARNNAVNTAQVSIQQQRAYQEAEPILRHAYALELAEEHKIDINLLEADTAITTPEAMLLKARELALDKREKSLTSPEIFDGGASGNGGSNQTLDEMDGLAKVTYALGRPAPRKR